MDTNLLDAEDRLSWYSPHLACSRAWVQPLHARLGEALYILIKYTVNLNTNVSELGTWQPLPMTMETFCKQPQ